MRHPVDPGSLGDEALLAGFGLGEPAASAAFVRRHQRRVFGVALRVVSDPATADDVSQAVFVAAWRGAASYDPRRATVLAWLLTITRNMALDELRRRRAHPLAPADLEALAEPSSAPEPARHAIARDDLAQLRQALDALPAVQRRALVLSAWHARTAEEIGELEGIPVGTAKTRIRDGLRRVRAACDRMPERVP